MLYPLLSKGSFINKRFKNYPVIIWAMKPLTQKTILEKTRLLLLEPEFKNGYFGFIFIFKLMNLKIKTSSVGIFSYYCTSHL